MIRDEEAGRARGFRSKAEPSGGKLGHGLRLSERSSERQAPQTLFEGPGGIVHRPGLDDEETFRVEAERHETGPVRVPPLACHLSRQAPEQEFAAVERHSASSNRGEGEAERGGRVAIGSGLDLMQPRLGESVEKLLPPEREKAGKRVQFPHRGRKETPTRRRPSAIANLPLAGGGI